MPSSKPIVNFILLRTFTATEFELNTNGTQLTTKIWINIYSNVHKKSFQVLSVLLWKENAVNDKKETLQIHLENFQSEN